jgi:predicted dehydrogenase
MDDQGGIGRRDFLKGVVGGAASVRLTQAAQSDATSKRVRYGIVGSGARSRYGHLPLLKRYFPNVEIVALCDITPENLQEGLRICGPKTQGYAYHRDMLEKHPELDAVIVIVPEYKHAEITLHALEAGKHVLCEKPMATHLADADRMIGTARRMNRTLQIGHQMRYTPVFQRAAEMIQAKRIGAVEYVFGALFRGDWNPHSWKYTDPVTGVRTNWRYLTLCEGSALLEDGIHELDVIHWLVGADPKSIEAVGGNNIYRDRQTIDHAGLLIEFEGGAKCNFAFTLFTPGGANGRVMRFCGSTGELSIEGSNIVIQPYRGRPERVSVANDAAPHGPGARPMRPFDSGTYHEHQAFLHSILTGAPPFASGKVGRDAAHISLAAEHSLRNGGKPLAWGDEADL